jgi:glutamate racemase
MENKHLHSIGLFDSGIGGLTVMQQIMQTLPQESLIYFGDTARVPYGGKSRETIIRYSLENANFLLEKGIKLLVVACNTASAFALDALKEQLPIPVIGVIEPGAEKAASISKNQRIAVLGTKGTIQSGAYQREIKTLVPQATIIPIACPLFVPLVEERLFHHPATRLIIKEYLQPLRNQEIDTVLLGCTHYPFLKHFIQEEMGSDVQLVDSASTCAEKICKLLKQQKLNSMSPKPTYHYYVSDDPRKFQDLVETLFPQTFNISLNKTQAEMLVS